MFKILIPIFLIIFSITLAHADTVKIIKNANIRLAPKIGSKVISWAKKGEKVNRIVSSNGWTKIQRDNGKVGWVSSKLIYKYQVSNNREIFYKKNRKKQNFFVRGALDDVTPYSYDFEHYLNGELIGITSKEDDVISKHLKPGAYQYKVIVKVIFWDAVALNTTIHIKNDGSIYNANCTGGYKKVFGTFAGGGLDWYTCNEEYK